jgi:hypothetical protein
MKFISDFFLHLIKYFLHFLIIDSYRSDGPNITSAAISDWFFFFFANDTCITQKYQGLQSVRHMLAKPSGPEASHTAVQA